MIVIAKVFDLIPGWLYAVGLAILLSLLGVDSIRIAELKTKVADGQTAMATLKTELAQAADAAEKAARTEEGRHQADKQEAIDHAHSHRNRYCRGSCPYCCCC